MTNLINLKYSLTKFGAYKVAYLLIEYRAEEVLSNLDKVQGQKIDSAQVKKILSVDNPELLPFIWNKVR